MSRARKPAALFAITAALLLSQTTPPLRPGPLTDGSNLLPIGWRIKPAGIQVAVGAFPTSSALTADGRFLLILNSGSPASVSVIRTNSNTAASTLPLPGAWQGIALSADNRNVYVSGGPRNSLFELTLSTEGALALSKEMPTAATPPAATDLIGDIAIPPSGRLIYAADLFHDQILVFNPQSGRVIDRFKSGRRPYQILFHPDGKSYFVSCWADASVYQYETDSGKELARVRVAAHATGMVLSDRRLPDDPSAPALRLFVAAANTNNVYTIAIDRNKLMSQVDVLNLGFAPGQPSGMTPSAVALSKDQTHLFIAASNVNVIAVADISEARSRLAGFIPTGAFPTSVRTLNDSRLAVTNGHNESISLIPAVTEAALDTWTSQALELVGFDPGESIPFTSPLENVVYVIHQGARGPNFAKLSRQFAAVDNFYLNAPGEEGIQWSLSGVPSDFAQRLRGKPFAATDPANVAPAGTLLTNARLAGLTTGEFGPATPDTLPPTLPRYTQIRLSGADADRTLGQLIETLSKSPLWSKTAVFVAGETPPLLVISPYSRRTLASNGMFYNQSSVLRTMELILKLRPMSLFDASARPLTDLFSKTAESTPFSADNP
ncbi:MAG: bifunctional YncE family protein/alkaline phosphatase family protein [Acidobacteriota bacterium]